MAGVGANTTSIQTNLFWSKTITKYTRASGTIAHSELVGSGKIIIDEDPDDASNTNLVKECHDIGEQGTTANNFEDVVYGKDQQKLTPGPSSAAEFSFAFAVDRTDALHRSIMESKNGTSCVVAIQRRTSATAYTVTALEGKISSQSQSTPTTGVTLNTVTIAITERPVHVDQTP